MKPLVSIYTLTYNHAPYIRRCIEGVLMQKTTFPYEMIIGEDFSTDGTREIVMEYAQKYPNIIRVITSESNVGLNVNAWRTFSACQGEFIAFCEGDDYWIDPLKLQKQYEAIVKYDALLVVHGSFMVFYRDGKIAYDPKIRKAQDGSGFLYLEHIFAHRTTFHTSSLFLRAHLVGKMPDWFSKMPVADFPMKVICAQMGKIYYIDEIMSVYQKGVEGSFTDRVVASESQEAEREKGELMMYSYLDDYTGSQYIDHIRIYLNHRKIEYFSSHGNLDYLDLSASRKKLLRSMAFLLRPIPKGWKKKILRLFFSPGKIVLPELGKDAK
jgi:glycosyltransferase involved in cell wall biosynthesis